MGLNIEYDLRAHLADSYYRRSTATVHRMAQKFNPGVAPGLMEVERHIWETLPLDSPLLITGIENGRHALFHANNGHRVVGIDGSRIAINEANHNKNRMNIDNKNLLFERTFLDEYPVEHTPFGQFGTIIIMSELERDDDPTSLLAKALRMAKYNVIAVIPKERSYHEPMRKHFFKRSDIDHLIKSAQGKPSIIMGHTVEEIMRSKADENTKQRMYVVHIIKGQ